MAAQTKLPSLTRNALLNSMRTVSSLLFPLITFPYVSRILGAENIGKINYSQSIVSYFALFAGLGITNYAIREGAKIKRDAESLTRFAQQIFTINIISSAIAYVAFFVTVAVIPSLHAYMVLLLIQCLTIGFTTLGVEWLYSIFEDYLYISVRTILVQVASLILMFAFVHKPSDYIIYAAISVFATSAANVWGFFYSRRYAKLALTRAPQIRRHFNPIMTLFMNNVATAIYSNAGTTFVGAMLGDVQVGLYSVAMKVYVIIRQAINSLTGVSMPRLSYLSSNDPQGYRRLLNKLFNAVIVVCLPAAVMVFALSRPIVLIISGPNYIEAVPMLEIIAFALAFTAPGVFLMNGILIPLRREKKVVVSTASGAAINILIYVVGIRAFGAPAACVSIVVAECTVFALALVFSWDQVKQLRLGGSIMHAVAGCLLVLLCNAVFARTVRFDNIFVDFAVRGTAYAVVYAGTLLALRDESALFFLRKLIRRKG
ncbi:flippase [uncultured Bifidobacterium sp.]|uniref:flippase n=1 Tax=uncultured Bifidobacterium sp. TaxID=165187 RepID=UPI0025917CC2|nr:flippase [uncultured Bifidobacterium sp.]